MKKNVDIQEVAGDIIARTITDMRKLAKGGRGPRDYSDAAPGSSDGQRHEYGKTCKQRWAIDVRLPELGDGTVAVCLFRKRRDAMRAKGRATVPRLVTS